MTAVVDALMQPAFLLDRGGIIRHANAAAASRFGVKAGDSCRAVLRCEEPLREPCMPAEVLDTGAPRTCLLRREGVHLGLRLAPVGAAVVLATLAEAVAVEHLPGDTDNLLQTILDSSSDVVIACNRNHTIEYVNRTFVERLGVPAAALVGRNFREVWRPFPGLDWDELEERVLERGEVVRLNDQEYKHAIGGGTVWVNVTFSPRRDVRGAIVGSVTTINYLTEQRRLALQLAASERRYQDLFEGAPVGLIIVGRDRRMLLVNPTAARMIDDQLDFTGRGFDALIAPEDRDRIVAAFGRAFETGQPRPEGHDFSMVRPDGARRRVHVRSSQLEYQGQRCALGAFVDVTEIRRLQGELARAERLAGLGTLAAGVAHEFNNVLAAIQGRAEIIAGQAWGAEPLVGECARAIVRHSRRGVDIIGQIHSLAAARPVRPVALRWEEVTEDVLASLQPRLAEEHITVERSYQAQRPLRADPGQVNQLVMNLLQNAREAIRPLAGGTIRIGTRDLPDGVALDVADTGVGMDELTREHLFDPFFTTKGSRARAGDLGPGLGMGLGLAIVHGIVRAHDGRVEVASTPGQGSRLTVVFPAAIEAAELGRSGPVAVPAVARPLRVTVVDDDLDVTEMIALALGTRGCTAITVNDGRRAADVCVDVDADVIIMDRVMPPVDGLEVVRQVRRRGVRTPVVLLSGRRAEEDPEELRALGVTCRLEKPVGLAELFAAVDAAAEGAPPPPANGGCGGGAK